MRAVKVTFANGNSLVTSINGTDEEIRRYYVGNRFNLGVVEDDLQEAVHVAFLPPEGQRRVVRWENGQRSEAFAAPAPFGADRAAAIMTAGSEWANYDKHMTDGEIAHVLDVWDAMPGNTAFYDALNRIRKGEA